MQHLQYSTNRGEIYIKDLEFRYSIVPLSNKAMLFAKKL